jgi:histidinol dehydrogenase
MRCERLVLTVDPAALAARLRGFVPAPDSVSEAVAEIIAGVRAGGDDAVREYTRRFDATGVRPGPLRIGADQLQAARERLDPAVRAGLEQAIENVRAVSVATMRDTEPTVAFPNHEIRVRTVPLGSAGVYVPGGRAPYPSTVVMGVVSARAAGVSQIAVCAPPARDGGLDPVVLGACQLTGATAVYRMGGAQAIAALAHGTESVAPVDVIVGPGNLYVQEAKRQVSGQVAIDGFAGPSDLLVIADGGVDPAPLALDLLAQAEHGPGTLVVAVSSSPELLEQLGERLRDTPDTGAVACLVEVTGPSHALELAQAFAPEHIQLIGESSERLAHSVTRAGCVFVGTAAGTAFGDYIAGSNHILPTNGAARFASALSPAHFQRTFTEVRIADPTELARAAAPVARAEGFELHARSMEARIGDNGEDDSSS